MDVSSLCALVTGQPLPGVSARMAAALPRPGDALLRSFVLKAATDQPFQLLSPFFPQLGFLACFQHTKAQGSS